MTCNDLILTNFHVIRDAAKKFKPHADIPTIKLEFAPGNSGRDILLATGNRSAIRKSCNHSCNMNHASSEKKETGKAFEIITLKSQTKQLENLRARVLHIDEDRDLALLGTRPPFNQSDSCDQMSYMRDLTGYIKLPFASKEVQILDKTYVFGCPQKYASSASAGIISHINRAVNTAGFQNVSRFNWYGLLRRSFSNP